MAVSLTYSNVTIRGITYSKGSSFKCYSAVKGNGGSEGNGGSAAAPTVGTTYYFHAKATGSNVSYPYAISATSGGSVKAWYTEAIFPYATYSVKYNANGGSGAPAAQTKTYGTNLTLSSTKPTRTGYTFQGWGTSASDTSVDYASGATYSNNAAITLYAIWQANTYTISFNANGGSGAPSSQTKTYGVNLKLSSTKPTRTNYEFLGWSTNKNASTATYSAGGTFTTNAATTLYAVWKLKYLLPTITNLKAIRCDSSGNPDDFGTYAKVTFDWACSQLTGTNNVSSITINGTSVSASGTSGSVSKVIGGSLSIETTHTITVKVIDTLKSSGSGTTTKTITLSAAVFAIDFLSGGKGVAIGKPASEQNLFDVQLKTRLHNGLEIGNSKIRGESSHCMWIYGRDNALFASTKSPASTEHYPFASMKTTNGAWTIATYSTDKFYLTYTDDTSHNSGENSSQVHALTIQPNGIVYFPKKTYVANDNGDAYYHAECENYMISFGIGSGKVNRGIYDESRDQWTLYNDATNTYIQSSGQVRIKGNTGNSHSYLSFSSATGGGVIRPSIAPTTSDGGGYIGTSNNKFTTVYATTATIQTSDRNQKENIFDIDSKYVELFYRLRPVTYELKGPDHDRVHIGFIAQDLKEAMDELGITAEEFAAYCEDDKVEYDEETGEEIKILDENGEPVKIYSLRYEEFIALNTLIIQKQDERINDLESRLAKLEALLGVE